ncbi:LysR family transcriptional regulator [Butyrivibrio sp. INlla16]|uniref:LysR family transcriptional regulator n=1 Tax=Butyrivibrio sp. INlla16 TaxID=1520807 RepID=UPI000880E991|nr:LysR family transcriptional regulator [Butyrivibrio sp. INlla16]SDB68253.1 DNA-binding transcriptional regulator, LysR family [Butyrivibrio sp. INlla16]
MELRHIRYFLTIAEEGSFTKAAEKLCIAQPPLSRQIRDLEEELDTQLFVRKARGLELTESGERFMQYARRIKQLSDQSLEDIREMREGLTGRLYLATVEGHAPELFASWICDFKKKYPLVEYEVWNGNSDDVVKRVHAGLNEVGVITLPYDEEGLDGRLVYTEPWVAMIPENHPLATEKGDSIEIAKLAPYELIIPSRRSRRKEIENWFAPLNCEPKIICRIAHMLNAYELTAGGLGIAIYPASAAKYISKGVVIKRIVKPDVTAGYVLVKSSKRNLSKVAEEFWNMVNGIYDDDKK